MLLRLGWAQTRRRRPGGWTQGDGCDLLVRDLPVHQILEGTNEIMRVIISRDMLKG